MATRISPRDRLPLLAALLAGLFAFALLPGPARAAGGYDLAKHREYQCFMRDFMDFNEGELNQAYNAAPDRRYLKEDLSFDEEKLLQAASAGAAFLKRHGDTLEVLVSSGYDRVLAPLPVFDASALDRIGYDTPVVHYKYSREAARSLVCVAAHAFREGRGLAAWRFLNAVIRFGASLRSGEGSPPPLIQGMIGIAIVNIGTGPLTWQVLAESDLTLEELRGVIAEVEATLAEWLPFHRLAKAEHSFLHNTIRDHLFAPALWQQDDRTIGDILTKIPAENRSKAVELTLARVAEVYDRTFALLDTREAGVAASVALLRELSAEIERRGSPSLVMIFSPAEALGDLLLGCAYPNFGHAYRRDAECRMRLLALRSGGLLLAGLRGNRPAAPLSHDVARALCGTLPVDIYAATREIRLIERGDTLLLYSVGEDGMDDGGVPDRDLILFLIRSR